MRWTLSHLGGGQVHHEEATRAPGKCRATPSRSLTPHQSHRKSPAARSAGDFTVGNLAGSYSRPNVRPSPASTTTEAIANGSNENALERSLGRLLSAAPSRGSKVWGSTITSNSTENLVAVA